MKIVIAGTHFTPAQATIEELTKNPDHKVVYLGRGTTLEGDSTPSLESIVLPKIGIKFIPITAGRLQRSFTMYTIPSLLKIPVGFLQAFYFLIKEKPDVVVSYGGYIGLPVVIAAWFLSIPIIVHQQTLVAGLATQISSIFASKIAVSFKQSLKKSPKWVLTGNPIRKKLLEPDSKISTEIKNFIHQASGAKLPIILITGGNQGSHFINQLFLKVLNDLLKVTFVIHQTGDSSFKDFDQLCEVRQTLKHQERYLLKKWINASDWCEILKEASLVITRGGVNTLSELAFFGTPSLIIPIPYLYQDEQNKNAKFFVELGLARVLPQSEVTAKKMLEIIQEMLDHLDNYKKNALKAREFIIVDAAKRLAQEVILLGEKNV